MSLYTNEKAQKNGIFAGRYAKTPQKIIEKITLFAIYRINSNT